MHPSTTPTRMALSLASLQTNGYDFELASATSDLTIENAFALSGGETLSTRGADLVFESSADISSGSTLDASGTDNSSGGGKLEFQLGGTDNGTINARNATFKIGAAYSRYLVLSKQMAAPPGNWRPILISPEARWN